MKNRTLVYQSALEENYCSYGNRTSRVFRPFRETIVRICIIKSRKAVPASTSPRQAFLKLEPASLRSLTGNDMKAVIFRPPISLGWRSGGSGCTIKTGKCKRAQAPQRDILHLASKYPNCVVLPLRT
ncbi:hypothetical protein [Noviherbaspirillum aerium]|uniref:hypothetical protein n=1 Tax=Noviherbaspirillum aerium TaxID=2588497 RepID=UPI00124C0D8B|nr:hypothetical protein [Noviherbaspirillum aerium]